MLRALVIALLTVAFVAVGKNYTDVLTLPPGTLVIIAVGVFVSSMIVFLLMEP